MTVTMPAPWRCANAASVTLSTPPLTAMAIALCRRRASPRRVSGSAGSFERGLFGPLFQAAAGVEAVAREIVALGLGVGARPGATVLTPTSTSPCWLRASRRGSTTRCSSPTRRPIVEVSQEAAFDGRVRPVRLHQQMEGVHWPALLADPGRWRDRARPRRRGDDRRRPRFPRRSCRRSRSSAPLIRPRRRRAPAASNTSARRMLGMPGKVARAGAGADAACSRPARVGTGVWPTRWRRIAAPVGVTRSPPMPSSRQAKPVSEPCGSGCRHRAAGRAGCATRPPPRGRGETVQRAPSSAAAMLPAAVTSSNESQSAISWKCTSDRPARDGWRPRPRRDGAGWRSAGPRCRGLSGAASDARHHVGEAAGIVAMVGAVAWYRGGGRCHGVGVVVAMGVGVGRLGRRGRRGRNAARAALPLVASARMSARRFPPAARRPHRPARGHATPARHRAARRRTCHRRCRRPRRAGSRGIDHGRAWTGTT